MGDGDGERDDAAVLFFLVAGAICCVVVAIVIGLVFNPVNDTLEYELWNLAIQALLIGALGALLGAAIQENRGKREAQTRAREAEREQATMLRDFQREQLTTALNDLALEYRLIKRSRRMLRLERPLEWKLYRKELGRLEDLQRSLEDSEGILEILAATTSLRLERAIDRVGGMISCLDALWKERENSPVKGEEAEFDAAKLTELQRFIDPVSNDNSSFQSLKRCYKSAREQILALLAELSGAEVQHLATVLADDEATSTESS